MYKFAPSDRACACVCEAAEGIAVVDLAAVGIAYPKGNRQESIVFGAARPKYSETSVKQWIEFMQAQKFE